MRKWIVWALVVMMLFTVVGCGKTSEEEAKLATYDKYVALIEAMESGDYVTVLKEAGEKKYSQFDQYLPLLDAMESGDYSAVLKEAGEKQYTRFDQYLPLLDALEEGDYEATTTALALVMPAAPAPQIIEAKITLDNFFDYYEIVYEEDKFDLDAEGNIIEINMGEGAFRYKLKPEYQIADRENSNVTIAFTCEYVGKDLDWADFSTGQYAFKTEPTQNRKALKDIKFHLESQNTWPTSATKEGADEFKLFSYPRLLNIWKDGNTNGTSFSVEKARYGKYNYYVRIFPDNFQLLRAEGVLYLYADQN